MYKERSKSNLLFHLKPEQTFQCVSFLNMFSTYNRNVPTLIISDRSYGEPAVCVSVLCRRCIRPFNFPGSPMI